MNHRSSFGTESKPTDPFEIPLRAVCIGCGCDDFYACLDDNGQPCQWLRVDYDAGQGVCSCCSEAVPDWDHGRIPDGAETAPLTRCDQEHAA